MDLEIQTEKNKNISNCGIRREVVRKSKKRKGSPRTKKRVSGIIIILVTTAREERVRKKMKEKCEEMT